MKGLTAQGFADLAGVTEVGVVRLVGLGILVARDGADPFLETDVPRSAWPPPASRLGSP